MRRAVLVSSVFSFGTGFCGGPLVVFYASTMLEQIGMEPTTATYLNIPLTGTLLLASVYVTFTADSLGRRKLTLMGSGSLVITNSIALVLTVLFDQLDNVNWIGYLFVVDAIFILLAFGASMAPIPMFIGAELSPQNARSGVQSIAAFTRYISIFAAGAIFPPLQNKIGGFAFLLVIIPMILVFLFLLFTMPETMNRTYDQVLEEWNKFPWNVFGRKHSRKNDQENPSYKERRFSFNKFDTLRSGSSAENHSAGVGASLL